MKPLIIDTHCHLDDHRFDRDLDDVIKMAHENGVRAMLIPGADINDLKIAQEISRKYKNIFFAAGVHPYHAESFDIGILEKYLGDENCIAIGECGLDYFRLPKETAQKEKEIANQKDIFIKHIKLAQNFKKPLIVHIRDANEDSFEILENHAVKNEIGGVLHCFNASPLLLKLRGFYFGIGGVLTFSNAKDLVEILPKIPKDKLLFETDAPYLTPHPHRGRRNEPSFTLHVVEKAAEILNDNVENLAQISSNNAKNLFKEFKKAN